MKRRQKRKLVLLVLLSLLLVALGVWYVNFRATKSLTVDLRRTDADTLEAPSYLYSFNGRGKDLVQQPVGVLATDGLVYVADARAGMIFTFRDDGDGTFVRTFGWGRVRTPLYLAKNPKDGLLYVADRRLRAIIVFKPTGEYVRTFDPKLPKSQLPTFDTKGDQWAPVALDFAPDGTMYVLEILNGHRLLIFSPNGTFKKSVGHMGLTDKPDQNPEAFQFPNSVKVRGSQVYVVDSNNRRVQVFDLEGTYKRSIGVSGLPRGLAFLPKPSGSSKTAPDRFVAVDTLSHDGTIWSTDGKKLVGFGSRGVLDGQFNYPNDVSIGLKSVIFVSDTNNQRIEAWGWPAAVSPIPRVLPSNPWWCLLALPLLLLPLFMRKKKFFATADFVEAMYEAGKISSMQHARRAWFVTEEDYAALADLSQDGISLGSLLEPMEYSATDAKALQEKLEIQPEQAIVIVSAQRCKFFCTEDAELRRIARLLELDVLDSAGYLERFGTSAPPSTD